MRCGPGIRASPGPDSPVAVPEGQRGVRDPQERARPPGVRPLRPADGRAGGGPAGGAPGLAQHHARPARPPGALLHPHRHHHRARHGGGRPQCAALPPRAPASAGSPSHPRDHPSSPSLSPVFVSMRWDATIDWDWTAVFVPLWVWEAILLVCCVCCTQDKFFGPEPDDEGLKRELRGTRVGAMCVSPTPRAHCTAHPPPFPASSSTRSCPLPCCKPSSPPAWTAPCSGTTGSCCCPGSSGRACPCSISSSTLRPSTPTLSLDTPGARRPLTRAPVAPRRYAEKLVQHMAAPEPERESEVRNRAVAGDLGFYVFSACACTSAPALGVVD